MKSLAAKPVIWVTWVTLLGISLSVTASADVLPPPLRNLSPKAPQAGVCVRKLQVLHGPRGSYLELTLPLVDVVQSSLVVQPAQARKAVVALLTAAPMEELEGFYAREPETQTPRKEVLQVNLFFEASGALRVPVVLRKEPQTGQGAVRLNDVKQWLQRRGSLPVQRLPVSATFELHFSLRCATLTCPDPDNPNRTRVQYGRPSKHCP